MVISFLWFFSGDIKTNFMASDVWSLTQVVLKIVTLRTGVKLNRVYLFGQVERRKRSGG